MATAFPAMYPCYPKISLGLNLDQEKFLSLLGKQEAKGRDTNDSWAGDPKIVLTQWAYQVEK